MRGSNPRLLAHKTNTLPTELMELNQQVARMAQWIRRLPTEQEILGSSPSMGFFFLGCVEKKKKKKKKKPQAGLEPAISASGGQRLIH